MIDAAVRVEVAVSDMPATLALRPRGGEALLERVDRAHVHGIDAAEHGEVERDEVAEQDERDEPLQAASRRCATTRSTTAAPSPASSAVTSIRRAARSSPSGSSRNTAPSRRSAPAQPTISLWSCSGSLLANAGISAFSLIWHFQRYATDAVRPAPVMTGIVPCSARASRLASPSSSPSGPHSPASSAASAAAPSISSRSDGAAPHSAAASSAVTSE